MWISVGIHWLTRIAGDTATAVVSVWVIILRQSHLYLEERRV
jgi:hypothetical protein